MTNKCQRSRFTWATLLCASALAGSAARADAPPFYPDKQNLLRYIDEQGREHPVKTAADWRIRRSHIVENFQLVMGEVPGDEKRVPLDVKVLEEIETPLYIQKKITYLSEPGDPVPAYLLIPRRLEGPAPAMLCLHQSVESDKGEPVGLSGKPNLHYARELTERGYVTLTPDFPRYGDYPIDVFEMGYASVTQKGVWNHMRGIDLLQELPEVDPDRIGCIGHSLGGYNTIFVAVVDERIKVVVSSCGFCSFFKYRGGRIEPWGSPTHHMPRVSTVYDNDPARLPFDFTELLAAIAPRPVFVNAPVMDGAFPLAGVHDCLNAAGPVYELLGAKQALVAQHPNVGHSFPPQQRKAAYELVDKALGHRPSRGEPATTRPAAAEAK
jgi:dienelactone hydrolase